MKKRQIIIVAAGIALVVGAVLATRWMSSGSSNQTKQVSKTSATVVSTRTVDVQDVQAYVDITGRLEAEDRIDIYAEVAGVLLPTNPAFKVGNKFEKGNLMVHIDNDEAQQNLRAQLSGFMATLASVVPDLKIDFPDSYETWKDYLLSLSVQDPIPPLPEPDSEQLRLFLGARNVYTQYYNIRQLEEQLDKYRLYAPFAGTLTEANINVGTLVRQGQKLGEFIRANTYELETAVRPEELAYIKVGDAVELSSALGDRTWQGTIARINDRVESSSQTVKVFIRLEDKDLRAGMYLEGRVKGRMYEDAFEIPRDVLVNNKVFIMKDSTAQLLAVEPLKRSDKVAIVRGLEDGMTLIVEDNTEAFAGTKVMPESASADSTASARSSSTTTSL